MMSLARVFIANRGEMAVRIVRACRALGLECVVGASQIDMDGMAAELADRVVCIGPSPPSESYLRPDVSMAEFERFASARSDTEAAIEMQRAKRQMLLRIAKRSA